MVEHLRNGWHKWCLGSLGSRSSASVAGKRLSREGPTSCGEFSEVDERSGARRSAFGVGPFGQAAREWRSSEGLASTERICTPLELGGFDARLAGPTVPSACGAPGVNSFRPCAVSSGPAPATACSNPFRSANRRMPLSWGRSALEHECPRAQLRCEINAPLISVCQASRLEGQMSTHGCRWQWSYQRHLRLHPAASGCDAGRGCRREH